MKIVTKPVSSLLTSSLSTVIKTILGIIPFICFRLAIANFVPPQIGGFVQMQSFLADFQGAPLVSGGNWLGDYRPYLWKGGKYIPIISSSQEQGLERMDFFSPTPLADHSILLAGQFEGSRNFDVFTYDVESNRLLNVTDSKDVDDGDYCVLSQGGAFAFRSGSREQFFHYGSGHLKALPGPSVPGFYKCQWLSARTVVGVTRATSPWRWFR